jgi:uncharacterized phage protein gp47/JayE
MPRFQTKRYEQILTEMLAKLVARTDLSDISDSAAVKHLLATAARQDDEQYYQMHLLLQLFSIDKATGEDLDERAMDIQPGTIVRAAATKAVGTVVLTRAGTTGTIILPAGIRMKTAGGIIFVTTAAGSITASSPEQIGGHGVGRDSGVIPVIAEVAGVAGNVTSNTIIKFVSKPVGVDSVTNPSGCIHGVDTETDAAFRARIKLFVASLGRSTVPAIESCVLQLIDPDTGAVVLYSKAVEDIINPGNVTLYIDDGTGYAESAEAVTGEELTEGLGGPPADTAAGGETTLYLDYAPIKLNAGITLVSSERGELTEDDTYFVNPASGQIVFDPALVATETITAHYHKYLGLIALAQKVVDGDPDDRVNYPGYRAAGILVVVQAPQVLMQTVSISVTVAEGYDDVSVKVEVAEAIKTYINSLGISRDVLRSELISRAQRVTGVYDIVLTTPATNVILLDDQLARVSDQTITVN